MGITFRTLFFVICVKNLVAAEQDRAPPHIITIIADDVGWNDVGFHGSSQIPTPNIDALAYNGVILNSHYVQPLCTPSRAAFLTSKYPIHLGMQHLVLLENEPRGMPLEEKLLPQYLKEVGYSTHAVGKWHLGFYKKEYTPTYRGFDSHFGYWNGFQDYYDQSVDATFHSMKGFDLKRNMEPDYESRGNYSTHMYTKEAVKLINEHNASKPMFLYLAHLAAHTGNMDNPLQAPDEEIAKFSYIEDPERRVYAAMLSVLDQSVGEVIAALRQKNMLENSIILFFSDNGAPTFGIHANSGSNYPLRGQKDSPWEGSSRGVAAIWSPLLKNTKRVFHDLIHVTDWLPTLWSAIGRNLEDLGNIDGISVWDALVDGEKSPRKEFVMNIDSINPYAAVRHGAWKLINGPTYKNDYNYWFGETDSTKPYDLNSILSSRANSAFVGYITDKQIFAKHNNVSSIVKPLNEEMITSLRKQATLDCKINKESSFPCILNKTECIFNIEDDPCETRNLVEERPDIVQMMHEVLLKYQTTALPPGNVPVESDANPKYYNNEWVNWYDYKRTNVSSVFDKFTPTSLIALKVLWVIMGMGAAIILMGQTWKWIMLNANKEQLDKREEANLHSLFKHYSFDMRRKNGKEAFICPTVNVAQRIEMFEEREFRRK